MKLESLRESMVLRVAICALGAALVTLAILFTTIAPAGAFVLWGPHYDTDSIDPISYRFFSVNSAYETAFKDAEAAWDATTAPGYFQEQSWSWDPEVNVIDEEYPYTWWARTVGTVDGDGTWSGNEVEIQYNLSTMDDLTAYQKKIVSEHELGHAYGLDHVLDGCHVMRQGEFKFTCGAMPTADDIAGVEAIY